MNPCRGHSARLATACVLSTLAAAPAWAQAVPPPPQISALPATRTAPVAAAPAPGASAAVGARAPAASDGRVSIFEDDKVRIEETRDARGQVQRITVHSKTGGKSYEIIVPPGGQDASQHRGTAGQRAWSVFAF